MAFDLQEQEQIAEMKAWWHDYGRHIALGVAIVLVGYAAWQGWSVWQKSQAENAASIYAQVESAQGDQAKIKTALDELKQTFKTSPYTSRAALLAAREAFARGDLKASRSELEWVLANADEALARDLARQRIASILADEKQFDEAIKMVATPEVEGMEGAFAETRGDLFALKGDKDKAREAYKIAQSKLAGKGQSFIDMKLDALGAH